MSVSVRVTALLGALVFPAASFAAEKPEPAPAPKPVKDPADALAALIDRHLANDWEARGLVPAEAADDAEFVRRAYLDILGRTPKAAEAREFFENASPDKRVKLVDHLLKMPGHATYFAAVTRAQWLPQTATNFQLAQFGSQFETWLRTRYRENTPADQVVKRILTVKVTVNAQNPMFRFVQGDPNDPDAQMLRLVLLRERGQAGERRLGRQPPVPGRETRVRPVPRPPVAPYTRDQFWQFAAFFSELNPLAGPRPGFVGPVQPQSERNTIKVAGTDKQVTATFFDGTNPAWSPDRLPRVELADWLAGAKNPYFAKNMANRVWAHFFGIGLQDPVDEPGENNPPSHPELLKELGEAFAANGFDNRTLIRADHPHAGVPTVQQDDAPRSGRPAALRPDEPERADRAATVRLAGRRDRVSRTRSLPQPAELRVRAAEQPPGVSSSPSSPARTARPNQYHHPASSDADERQVHRRPDRPRQERSVGAVADVPGWDTKQRVGTLFLTAFARNPTAEESDKFTSYVDRGGAGGDKKKALADVFWVLLNSPEFLFNH